MPFSRRISHDCGRTRLHLSCGDSCFREKRSGGRAMTRFRFWATILVLLLVPAALVFGGGGGGGGGGYSARSFSGGGGGGGGYSAKSFSSGGGNSSRSFSGGNSFKGNNFNSGNFNSGKVGGNNHSSFMKNNFANHTGGN